MVSKSTSPDSRVTKWRLKLLEYDFDVVYKAGKTNVNADALSRNPVKSQNTAQVITYERERNGPSQGNDSIPFTEEELLEVPTTLEVQVDIHPTPIQPIRGIQTRNPPRRSGRLAQKSIWLGEGSDSDSSEPENDTPLSVKPKGEESKKLEVNTRRRGRPRKKPPEQMEPEDLDRIDAIDETGNIIEESTAEPIEDEDITSNSEEEMERLKIDDINSENEVDKRETRTVNQQKTRGTDCRIIETRDHLYMRRDNYVYFLNIEGEPCDKGSQGLYERKELPTFTNLVAGEVQVEKKGQKYHIAIIIRLDQGIGNTLENIKQGIQTLSAIIEQFKLQTINMAKTPEIGKIQWSTIISEIKIGLNGIRVKLIICLGIVQHPPTDERIK